MTNNIDSYQFTKSFEKTLETLRDIFGSNNEDLIASAIRFLKQGSQMNPRLIIPMLLALVIPYTGIEVYGTRTIESKIDDTVAELVRENQTDATHLMEQLVYLYRTHYDCSPNDEITYEDSCDISVSRGGNGLSINITFPLAESYGRGR